MQIYLNLPENKKKKYKYNRLHPKNHPLEKVVNPRL